jgi:RNA polymerase sigma-70 factor (ECF subfamily)
MEQLELFAAGDLGAFESLFRQFQGQVYGWIVRLVRDPASAEDLTLETFWKIYRARARFDPARDFGAWAHRVATNVALNHLAKVRAEAGLLSSLDREAAQGADPGIRRELQDALRLAFRSLPAKLQAVAALALVEGMSYPEVAQALGISAGAAKSREFRAVKLLRKKLNRLGVGL